MLKREFFECLVHGLIDSSIIWLFWTPFIIIIAVPVMSAIVKEQACNLSKNTKKMNYHPGQSAADNIINSDDETIHSINLVYIIVMIFSAIVFVCISFFICYLIISKYKFSVSNIVFISIIRFIIISFIEISFFLVVATQYVPFDVNKIINTLVNYINTNIQ